MEKGGINGPFFFTQHSSKTTTTTRRMEVLTTYATAIIIVVILAMLLSRHKDFRPTIRTVTITSRQIYATEETLRTLVIRETPTLMNITLIRGQDPAQWTNKQSLSQNPAKAKVSNPARQPVLQFTSWWGREKGRNQNQRMLTFYLYCDSYFRMNFGFSAIFMNKYFNKQNWKISTCLS